MTIHAELSDETLVERLGLALLNFDNAMEAVLAEAAQREIKMTESKLSTSIRNYMREREQELPEIARWRLRFRVGSVENHEV